MRAPKRVLSVLTIALVLALAFFVAPAITDSGREASANGPYSLIYYDGHMHTTRSDGNGSVAQIKATALARGLDAVIITDHCKDVTLAEWNSLVAETAAVSDGSFLALPGYEITGDEGMMRDHFLAYNAPDPFVGDDVDELCPEEVWPSDPNPAGTGPMHPENLAEWVDYTHAQGGLAVHNHTMGHTLVDYGVNNVEIYNQGHVDDLTSYALALGIPPAEAWAMGITINNFAIYGERDLMMIVTLPGYPPMPLRTALYFATTMIFGVGQFVGWSDPPNDPFAPGNLNSWDELLMAYVDGTADVPMFGVANSDSHNTGDPDSTVGMAKNGLYVAALTADDVYEAIEAGRSFATTGPSLALDLNGKLMGENAEVGGGGPINLNLSVDSESPTAILAQIDIIRNGEVLQTISPMAPTYSDTLVYSLTARGYYRVEVTSYDAATDTYHFAYSNPVFVNAGPRAVGGVVELHADGDAPAAAAGSSAGRDYGMPMVAAIAAATLVAFTAGAWYARRRWLG
jgi:hypothetical protein